MIPLDELFGRRQIRLSFIIVVLSLIVLCVDFIITKGTGFVNLTCNSDDADLPDFIEVVYRSYRGTTYDLGSTYLPLTFLVFKFLSFLTPGVAELTTREMTYINPLFLQFAILFTVLVVVSYGAIVYCIQNRVSDLRTKVMLIILLAISVPTFWLVERGNIIFLCLPLLLYFCLNYDSVGRKKWITLFLFALAVTIKPYSAVFAILLLRDRMFKDFLIAVAMVFLLNLIPLFVFGGLETIVTIFENMVSLNGETSFVDGYKMDITNTISEFMILAGVNYEDYSLAMTIVKILFVALIFISSLLTRTRWECVLLISLLYIMFSNVSWVYLLIQLFIPLLFMCTSEYSEEDDSKLSYFSLSFLLIILILIPVPFGFARLIGINTVVEAYLIKAVLLIVLTSMLIWKNFLAETVARMRARLVRAPSDI